MTKLKIVPQNEWEIIKKYLTVEGVVLIPENIAKEVKCEGFDEEVIDYDFGGDADCWVDIVLNKDHFALKTLKSES